MPLNDDLISSFVAVLDKIVSAAAQNASKLTNLEISTKISQYGESFVKDSKIQVEELSPVLKINNSLNADDPALLLTQSTTAALIANKMTGAENAEEVFSEDKQAPYMDAIMQSAKAAIESFEEASSGGLQITDSDIIMADPAQDDTLRIELDPDRYLFEITLSIADAGDKILYLDLSSKNINTLISLFESTVLGGQGAEAGGDETVGDFMGTNFAEIMDSHDPNSIDPTKNLNLLMDIRLGLIVELGRAEMHLRDILKLTKGSIIELDRLSGEPVDLFVNNKLIARGEVVVIDDNFGLRINQLAGNAGKDKKLIGAKD